MDKEKEIEEIAKVLHGALVYDGGYGWDDEQEVDCEETARNLVNAGYGNVKQAVKEFAEEAKDYVITLKFGNKQFAKEELYKLIDNILQQVENHIDTLFKELYGEDL